MFKWIHTVQAFQICFLNVDVSIFLRFYLFIFREGKGGRKRGRETSVCGCLLSAPTGDLAYNPAMCPD